MNVSISSKSAGAEFRSNARMLTGCILGVSIGVSSIYFYSLGIFIKPLASEYGWSRGQASLGALVGTLGAAIASPLVGRLLDKYGSRTIAIFSLLALAIGMSAHGLLISGFTSFLVISGLLAVATVGSSPMPYARLTVAGFQRSRGLALGLVLAGTGVGAILAPAILVPYIATAGWRAGYIALAGVVVLGALPVWLLLRTAHDPGLLPHDSVPLRDVLANPAFIPLGLMFFFASIAILGIVVQFVPMLSDAGLTPQRAGGIASLIGVAAIGGRLCTGFLLDRLRPEHVTAGIFLVTASGDGLLAMGGTSYAVPGALIAGLAIGAEIDLLAFLTARYFPRAAFGQANGLLYGLGLAGGAVGPALFGALYDTTGGYRASLLLAASLLLVAALIALLRLPRDRPHLTAHP